MQNCWLSILREIIVRVVETRGFRVCKAIVYGSVALGRGGCNDIDVVVFLDTDRPVDGVVLAELEEEVARVWSESRPPGAPTHLDIMVVAGCLPLID